MIKYLILENGDVFKGKSFGYDGEAIGELVFSTNMTGYLESLSDPAYFGQVLLQTFPLIGNYGVINQDFGPGPAFLKAYIVKYWCQEPSNFRSEGNLDAFLSEHKIPGLYDIDTRALTRVIRENGTMNVMLSGKPDLSEDEWARLKSYKIENAVETVCALSNYSPGNFVNAECRMQNAELNSCSHCGVDSQSPESSVLEPEFNVALWDFGDGFRASKLLLEYGFNPMTFNYASLAASILAKKPDAIMLTDGPGDPAENLKIIEQIKAVCESGNNIPIFAVGLGHQMLALANGAKTQKLKFGNRGANQPVRENMSQSAFVTQQNHSYAVVPDSLPDTAVVSYTNVNDGSCEGIEYKDFPAFSVSFEPNRHVMKRFRQLINNK